ncbi:MAG: aspartate/glutamate racemase family protein [Promethearchaeota archaeon]
MMKTIGLLGGMSWESSLEYYRIINELIQAKLGGLHSAQCVIYSVDFDPFEKWMQQGNWDRIGIELTELAKKVEKAGADVLIICTNTMHKLVPVIESHISIPILHIADAAAKPIKAQGLTKVGLLGTRFTMEEDFYSGRLKEKHGIDVIIPSSDDRNEIDQIIFEELVKGILTQESRDIYLRIIQDLQQKGAQGVILGCTEIPLLIKQADSPIPVFDTTQLHAEYAIQEALK